MNGRAKTKLTLGCHIKGALDNILEYSFWLNFIYHIKSGG